MDILDIARGYKLPVSVIQTTLKALDNCPTENIHSIRKLKDGSGSVVFVSLQDYLTQEPMNVLMLDSVCDVERIHGLLDDSVYIKENLRQCYLAREGFSLDDWLKSVKTRNSYINGEKYHRIEWRNVDVYSPEMTQAGINKCHAYPDFDYQEFLNFCLQVYNADKAYATYGTVDGEYLCCFICMEGVRKGKTVTFVPFADVTCDESLRKAYSPMTVAHVKAVRDWSSTLSTDLVDFGRYFKYKDIFNFNTYWTAGLTIKE